MNEMAHILFFKKFFLKILVHISLAVILVNGYGQDVEVVPEFLAQLDNLTAAQGRDISFTCVVENLDQYRVAWIKSDSKAILAIHTHMVNLNPRLSVTHNGHNTWKLHISHVQLNDSGSYMCQVNTDPMISISGYLNVVVPPDILNQPDTNSANLEEGITNEGGTIQLLCIATGVPEPSVTWKRENGKEIVLRSEGRDKQIVKHDGERLIMQQVLRTDMGGYYCIASNGIPPTVSKRFDVQVNFSPSVTVSNELVSAPLEKSVTLQCTVEAFPKPLNTWHKSDGPKLLDTTKYIMTESVSSFYVWHLNLTIKSLKPNDFGTYICSSVNALGKSEGRVRLQELRLPPKPTTTPTPYVYTTAKPRKKVHQTHTSKGESIRGKDSMAPNQIQENEILGPAEVTIPPIRTADKARNTQTPPLPSRGPNNGWIHHNGSAFTGRLNVILFLIIPLVNLINLL